MGAGNVNDVLVVAAEAGQVADGDHLTFHGAINPGAIGAVTADE